MHFEPGAPRVRPSGAGRCLFLMSHRLILDPFLNVCTPTKTQVCVVATQIDVRVTTSADPPVVERCDRRADGDMASPISSHVYRLCD